jgi:DNA-binding XRE family transcriptional regulator
MAMSGMPDTAAHDNADDVGMSRGKHALLITLGERIKRLRKRKGYTQTDLTVHLDMNRGHLSDIERGKREVGIITLQVIARGLNTSMSNLLRGL